MMRRTILYYLNAIDHAVRDKHSHHLVDMYYHHIKSQRIPIDIPCYKQLITFYHQQPSKCIDIYRDYCYQQQEQHVSGVMVLGPIVYANCLQSDDWKSASLVFNECMTQVLHFTNHRINNKQAIHYQDEDDRGMREEQEVTLITQFLNRFMHQLIHKLKCTNHNNTTIIHCMGQALDIIARGQLYETDNYTIEIETEYIQVVRQCLQHMESNTTEMYRQLVRSKMPFVHDSLSR
jgi:hypothetical protein